jgi:hypothetical protein
MRRTFNGNIYGLVERLETSRRRKYTQTVSSTWNTSAPVNAAA